MATAAFAAIAAGVVAIMAAPPIAVIAAIPFLCATASIFSIGLAVAQFPRVAFVLMLILPPIGGVYFAMLNSLATGSQTVVGTILIFAGAVPGILALHSQHPTPTSHSAPAHLH